MSCAAEVDAQRVYAWRVWDKLTKSYNIRGDRPSGCEFPDSWGNRIQVIDLHDESLIHPFKASMLTAEAGYNSIRLDALSVHSSYEKKSPEKAVLRQEKSRAGKSLAFPVYLIVTGLRKLS